MPDCDDTLVYVTLHHGPKSGTWARDTLGHALKRKSLHIEVHASDLQSNSLAHTILNQRCSDSVERHLQVFKEAHPPESCAEGPNLYILQQRRSWGIGSIKAYLWGSRREVPPTAH